MRAIGFAAMFGATLWAAPLCSAPLDVDDATNELSSEYAECAALFHIGLRCFGDQLATEPQAKKNYEASASLATKMVYALGKQSGVSDAALLARSELAMKQLTGLIEQSCRNISVIQLRYGDRCKGLMNNPAQRLQELQTVGP